MISEKMEKRLEALCHREDGCENYRTECAGCQAADLLRALLAYWQSPSADASAAVSKLLAEIENA